MQKKEKDINEKILISYPDVFAGIVNAFFEIEGYGDTAPKVKPEDLEDIRDWSFYKAADKTREQERDVVKLWKSEGIAICLIGIENQTNIDKFMPFRVFSYEGADYREQLNNKDKKKNLYPVITIVLYYGIKRRWQKNKSIFEILKLPDWLKPYVNDCHINVLELAWLTEEQEKFFFNDMRVVINYLRQKRMNDNYVPTPEEIKHYQAFFGLMQALSKEKRFDEIWKRVNDLHTKGEKIMIPGIFATLEEQAIRKGREQGLEEGIEKGIKKGREEALEEGIEKGRIEGRHEERIEVFEKIKAYMLKLGYSLEDINDILANS